MSLLFCWRESEEQEDKSPADKDQCVAKVVFGVAGLVALGAVGAIIADFVLRPPRMDGSMIAVTVLMCLGALGSLLGFNGTCAKPEGASPQFRH